MRLLPDWETLPYDTFSPHQDLVSERLATLHDLGEGRCDILLVPATTALYRMPPASFLAAYTFSFSQGERLDEAKLKAQLTLAGYEHVSQVVRPGEYCVRGSLLDLYPMGSPLPYRIDLFDDQVDSIRAFDPDTQRSLYPVHDVRLLPGREFPFDEAARTAFRSRWREVFEGDPSRSSIYKDIGNGVPSAGIEYYLPLFFDETATLFHYLPEGAQLAFVGDLDAAIKRFTNDTKQRYNFLSHDRERPILEPQRLFSQRRGLLHARQAVRAARVAGQCAAAAGPCRCHSLAIDRHADDPVAALRAYLDNDAEPRAVRRRIGGPARNARCNCWPTTVCGRSRATASRTGSTATRRSRSASRRSPTALRCRPKASRSSPRPSFTARSRAARDGAARNRRATSIRWCATCPSSRSATRSCMRSTASAAIWAS